MVQMISTRSPAAWLSDQRSTTHWSIDREQHTIDEYERVLEIYAVITPGKKLTSLHWNRHLSSETQKIPIF